MLSIAEEKMLQKRIRRYNEHMNGAHIYRELHTFDGTNQTLVLHEITQRICLKKQVRIYNLSVYQYLMEHPYPHIPRIFDFYFENETAGAAPQPPLTVIEEYIQGETLDAFLARTNPSERERLGIFYDVCGAVSFLHHAVPPIIHRDIKMENVMLDEHGRVYLVDYNAAKRKRAGESRDTMLIGTEGNAAPEQYGFGASDERTDIYALGVLLRQMLPGNERYRRIADGCTKIDPAQRYASVELLTDELGKATVQPAWRPCGQQSYAQSSYAQNTQALNSYAQNPYVQEAQAQNPYEQNAQTYDPYVQNTQGQSPYVRDPYVTGQQAQSPYTQSSREQNQQASFQQNNNVQSPQAQNLYAPAEHSAGGVHRTDLHTSAPRKRKGIFPPPGFRSGNPFHMVVAVIGYIALFDLCFTLRVDGASGPAELWFNRILIFCGLLAGLDICTDWTHLYDGLPGIRSEDRSRRILAKIGYSILAFVFAAALCGILSGIFFTG